MEVAPRYKLLAQLTLLTRFTLLTQFTLLTRFTLLALFILLKLLYTATTIACKYYGASVDIDILQKDWPKTLIPA